MIFHIDSAMKHSYLNDDTCFSIDVIDEILEEYFDALLDEGSEILHFIKGTILKEKLFAKFDEFMAMNIDENSESESDTKEQPFEKITFNIDYKIKTSLKEPPSDLELKHLPNHLEYVFFEDSSFLPRLFSESMESLSPRVVAAAKLSILNPNEFDFWKMRIEEYFLMTDYSLWDVILNGDSPIPTRVVDGVVQPIAPTTAEHRLAKKNELKERETLFVALPDKHKLKFNIHKDAKSLMEAIEIRFGGNKEIKKVQKTLIKQQYENFTGSSSDSLDQIHDRIQKLISQLEILGE
uniref:Ribonuclease H-like domain-containing protein n=1 Tax=Tanacetum cinerariifolium TaxID=118510 RepID=A0A699K5V0_TANCI|nr:ribonuclease H-like domain-containing protein [Tanacetum cinerariifolium]